jgi:DNA-binding NtrC family response regulator
MVPEALVIASENDGLATLVSEAGNRRWRVEACPDARSGREALSRLNLKLILINDEVVSKDERGWFLEQVRSQTGGVPVVYVASEHSVETERLARGHGVLYYTSKPVERDRLAHVLRAIMRPQHFQQNYHQP